MFLLFACAGVGRAGGTWRFSRLRLDMDLFAERYVIAARMAHPLIVEL